MGKYLHMFQTSQWGRGKNSQNFNKRSEIWNHYVLNNMLSLPEFRKLGDWIVF